jgi:hypothetical protein
MENFNFLSDLVIDDENYCKDFQILCSKFFHLLVTPRELKKKFVARCFQQISYQ